MRQELDIVEAALYHAHERGAFTDKPPVLTVQWFSALNALKNMAAVQEEQQAQMNEAQRIAEGVAQAGAGKPRREKKAAPVSAAPATPCLPCEEKAKEAKQEPTQEE